jgi:hypothetical protein
MRQALLVLAVKDGQARERDKIDHKLISQGQLLSRSFSSYVNHQFPPRPF